MVFFVRRCPGLLNVKENVTNQIVPITQNDNQCLTLIMLRVRMCEKL